MLTIRRLSAYSGFATHCFHSTFKKYSVPSPPQQPPVRHSPPSRRRGGAKALRSLAAGCGEAGARFPAVFVIPDLIREQDSQRPGSSRDRMSGARRMLAPRGDRVASTARPPEALRPGDKTALPASFRTISARSVRPGPKRFVCYRSPGFGPALRTPSRPSRLLARGRFRLSQG